MLKILKKKKNLSKDTCEFKLATWTCADEGMFEITSITQLYKNTIILEKE